MLPSDEGAADSEVELRRDGDASRPFMEIEGRAKERVWFMYY